MFEKITTAFRAKTPVLSSLVLSLVLIGAAVNFGPKFSRAASTIWSIAPTSVGFQWVSPAGANVCKYAGVSLVSMDSRSPVFSSKYPTQAVWGQAQSDRLKSWGFNAAGQYSYNYYSNSPADGVPYVNVFQASAHAVRDDYPYHVKNLNHDYSGMVCAPTYVPYLGGQVDAFDPGVQNAYNADVLTDVPYFGPKTMFIVPEEGDTLYGINSIYTHEDFAFVLTAMNPRQDKSLGGYSYADHAVYAKFALRDFLANRYGCAGSADPSASNYCGATTAAAALTALNNAWFGSQVYTTWNTSDPGGIAGIVSGTYNSYGTGTGLLDENGKNVLSATAKSACGWSYFSGNGIWGYSATIVTDTRDFVGYFASVYAQKMANAWAQSGANPHPPIFEILYNGPSNVYKAMAPYFDGYWIAPDSNITPNSTLTELQRIISSSSVSGGKSMPIILGDYSAANPDSPYPTSTVGGTQYSSQPLRGAGLASIWANALTKKDVNNKYVVVGVEHWSLYDSPFEVWNGGTATFLDNPYDGSAANIAASTSIVWQANHTYAAPAIIYNGTNYQALSGGITGSCTSGGSAPVWAVKNGQTTTDGTCIWRNEGPYTLTAETSIGGTATIPGKAYGDTITPIANFLNAGICDGSIGPPPPSDTTPPTVPTGLTASAVSSSQINLSWTASTDPDSVVSGYYVYRNGSQIANVAGTSYSDAGLSASTTYSYTVSAYDPSLNVSAQSGAISATTQSGGGGGGSTSTLVLAYSFDEASGSTVGDSSGNGNTGTANGTTIVAGKYNNARNFNGSTDYISVANNSTLNPPSAITIEAWVNPTSWGFRQWFIAKYASDSNSSYGMALDNEGTTTLRVFVTTTNNGLSQRDANVTISNGTWHYVAMTYASGDFRIYWDGNPVASYADVTGGIVNSTAVDYLGTLLSGYSNPYPGKIDDLRIYKVALTQSQIQSDMNTPVGITPPSDTTPPSIPTGFTATAVSSSQINLSWTASTDNVAVAGYKIYRGGTQIATTTATSYSDTGLSPSTTYSYTVAAYDTSGNVSAQSSPASATTQAAPDTTPPTVSITSPANGSTVANGVTVSANASDNVGVAGVQFQVDGMNLGAEVTVFPYTVHWDTASATDGSHTVSARARDAAGNTTNSSVTVTVSNISNVNLTNVGTHDATVNWSTNVAADSRVNYGLTTSTLTSTAFNAALVTAHSLQLTNLQRATVYYFQIISTYPGGNQAISGIYRFSTSPKPQPLTQVTAAPGSVILSWVNPVDPPPGGIKISRSTTSFPADPGTDPQDVIATLPPGTSRYTDRNVSPHIAYYYSLFTVDADGAYSDPAQISFTVGETVSARQVGNNTPTAAATADLDKNLWLGKRGDDVKTLQQFLVIQKLLPADSATGFFGNTTKGAVRSFQKSQNISSTGLVGPLTLERIRQVKAATTLPIIPTIIVPLNTIPKPQPTAFLPRTTTAIVQDQLNAILLRVQQLLRHN